MEAARGVQRQRVAGTKLTYNAEMGLSQVRDCCRVEGPAQSILKVAVSPRHLSARAYLCMAIF